MPNLGNVVVDVMKHLFSASSSESLSNSTAGASPPSKQSTPAGIPKFYRSTVFSSHSHGERCFCTYFRDLLQSEKSRIKGSSKEMVMSTVTCKTQRVCFIGTSVVDIIQLTLYLLQFQLCLCDNASHEIIAFPISDCTEDILTEYYVNNAPVPYYEASKHFLHTNNSDPSGTGDTFVEDYIPPPPILSRAGTDDFMKAVSNTPATPTAAQHVAPVSTGVSSAFDAKQSVLPALDDDLSESLQQQLGIYVGDSVVCVMSFLCRSEG